MSNYINIKKRARTRRLVKCNCPDCNRKYVDPRTRNKHLHNKNDTNTSASFEDDLVTESSTVIEDAPTIEPSSHSFINEGFSQEGTSFLENVESKFPQLRRRVRSNNTFWEYDDQMQIDENNNNLVDKAFDQEHNYSDEDFNDNEEEDFERTVDNDENEEGSDNFENYSSPRYEFSDDTFYENYEDIDGEWMLIFILRFQTRFRLADTAVNTLINFLYRVLIKLDPNRFKKFPTSLYTARKKLRLRQNLLTFSVCPLCHKLHDINDVKSHTI